MVSKIIKGYILPYSTFGAFESERLLKDIIHIKLIPTPREFSSECGFALYFETSRDIESIKNILERGKIEYDIQILD